jgi:hypothetical protein
MLKKYQLGGQPQPALDMDGTTPGEVYRTPVENRAIFDNVQDLGQFLEPLSASAESTDSPVSTSVLKETELVADAVNMDLDSFFYKYDGRLPQDVLTAEKLKKEAVPLERISGESIAPNIYRENRTKVLWNGELVDACAAGMQYAISSEETPNHMSIEDRKKLGIRGNAWHVGKNLEDNGGRRLYGLHEGTAGIMDTNKLRAKLISNRSGKDLNAIHDMADTGDIVEMYYPNSTKQQEASLTGTGTYTTHVGMVSTDAEGRKYVTHNIGGTWHTDDLATALSRTGAGNYFVSGIVRPAYEQGSSSISVNGDFQIKRSTGKTEPVQRTPEEIKQWSENFQKRKARIQPFLSGLSYYAPYVQEDMDVSNENMKDLVIPVSYALFGNESMFNDPDNVGFQAKRKNRDLIRGVKNIARSVGLDAIAPDMFDPMSEGLTQIKLDSGYLESKDGKELLTRYGIDEESIYDVSMSAAATQLLTAYNLKKLRGFIGPEKFDGLDLQTKRNLLLKAHNKGVDTVIQRDLLDEGIEKGLRTYSKLHIQEIPEGTPDDQKAFMRYTNTGNDFALELNVDYEKILKDKETADRIGYNVKPLPTFTEEMANSAEDGFSTLLSNAYSTMNEAKGSIDKIASEGKKLYESEGKRSVKTIAKKSEVEGQKLFAEMLRIGTITGDTGEMLQDSLNTATSSVQEISKAISQDMQRAAEKVSMDPLDVTENIARQTFQNKIPQKITETSNAVEKLGNALTAPKYRLQEFNQILDMEGINIPMSVQQKIMLDPRFQDGSMDLKTLIEEYLGEKITQNAAAPLDSAIQRVSADQLAGLMKNENPSPQMQTGGSLPKYKVGGIRGGKGRKPIMQLAGSLTAYDKTGFFSAEEKQSMFHNKPNQRYVPQGSPQDEAALSKLADPFKPEGSWKAQSTYNLHASGAMDHVAQGGYMYQFENPEYHIGKPKMVYKHGGVHDPTTEEYIPSTAYNAGPAWGHMLPEVVKEDKLPLTNQAYMGKLKTTNPIAYAATSAQNEAGNTLMDVTSMMPGIGDVQDVMELVRAIKDKDYGTLGIAAAATAIPFVGYGAFKQGKKLWGNVRNFDNYVSQEEAARLRAERMLSQQDKWVGQDVNTVNKFETAVQRHNPSDPTISKGSLGKNRGDSTGISSEADLNDANKARITSHEVGHYYRNAEEEANSWNRLFDFSKESPRTARYLRGKSGARPNPGQVTESTSTFKMDKGSPHGDELRERAAQLKDHIAFKNNIPLNKDFTITSKQLDDALKTYISDTKLDNSMTSFIRGLKDKKGLLNQMNTRPLSIAPIVGSSILLNSQKEKTLPKYQEGGFIPTVQDNTNVNQVRFTADQLRPLGPSEKSPERIRAERTYELIAPSGYLSPTNYINALKLDNSKEVQKRDYFVDPRSEEGFKQYLGINDDPKYISKSPNRPSKEKDTTATYYRLDKDVEDGILRFVRNMPYVPEGEMVNVNEFDLPYDPDMDKGGGYNRYSVLGNLQVGWATDPATGKKYASYYDKYDFPKYIQNGVPGITGGLKGKPFEFYNRIYFPEEQLDFWNEVQSPNKKLIPVK